jgi:predicted RNA binding protein YcfA (HicA-like mRNA interferase family)
MLGYPVPGDLPDCNRQPEAKQVPPKVRELIAELERAGFINYGGKGSHRNFIHPKVVKPVIISGSPGADAKHYQIRIVQLAIEESRK